MGYKEKIAELGMTEEEFFDFMNCMDEIDDYKTKIRKDFYILKEREEGKTQRVIFKDLNKNLPVDDIKKGNINIIDKESTIIQADGGFYPEIIEENGLYFISTPLYQYIKNKTDLRIKSEIVVGLVGEKVRRMEEYHLIIPYEIDCTIEGTEKYSKSGELVYFEIDDSKTGELDIFKVKGFPHLIITQKVNRINYGGVHCSRIENYFDYEGERDKVYLKRISGEKVDKAKEEYEKKAKVINQEDTLLKINSLLKKETIRKEMSEGLKDIYESYLGKEELPENLSERILAFFYSWENSKVYLAQNYKEEYEKTEINLECIKEIHNYIENLPEELKEAGEKICFETVLHCFATTGDMFDKHDKIHKDQRIRIYFQNEYFKSMNAPMVYDYKSDFQKDVESKDIKQIDFKDMDLREFDFSGKDMKGIKIEGCNLGRANFNGSTLEGAEFVNCKLRGAQFTNSNLNKAKFIDCEFDRVNFDNAKMIDVEIKGSDLYHSSFINTNLTNAKIINDNMVKAYFYKSKLVDAIFEISGEIFENVFCLSDLKRVKFLGDKDDYDSKILEGDFRKCDLSGSEFCVERIAESKFIKANLDGGAFYTNEIDECDFKWASCFMINIDEEASVRDCNFNWVDLSKMKVMKNISFTGNDFSYGDLSKFDFEGELFSRNKLFYTKLKNCNFKKINMQRNELIFPELEGANLENAKFKNAQLEYVKLSQKQLGVIEIIEEEGDNNG